MACHLLVNKLLPESMLTKTCHHMASLAHNVSNGHLIRNLHISSVLWPLCISCFNTGDVLHKEWCLTTDYHLHQDDPLQVSSLTKTSHIIHRFPYAIWGPSLISFFLSTGMGSGSSKQASKQANKNQEPLNSITQRRPSWIWDTEVGLLRPKAFMRLFQRDNSGVLCWSFYNDNTENRESTPKTHWGWHLPSDESIGGVHSSGYGDAPLPFGDIIE